MLPVPPVISMESINVLVMAGVVKNNGSFTQQKHGHPQKEKPATSHGRLAQNKERRLDVPPATFHWKSMVHWIDKKQIVPEGLWENEEQWSTTYNVLTEGGNSIVYFQSDGDMVGSGYSTNSAFNLSEVSCSWF